MHRLRKIIVWFGILAVLLALLGAIAYFGFRQALPGFAPKELHYGLTLSPSGIDPHVNASSELGIPLSSVYDTFVYRDADGKFIPGLAERWEISPDGLQYTFYLRRDVKFHDGTAFNAAAAKTNFDRILNPATKSQKALSLLGPVQTVTVADSYVLQMTLSAPFSPLLDSLSQVYLGMASPAALEKWGADYQFHQVGTGPFKFVEYVAGDHLTLEKNADYHWAPSVFKNSSAQVDRIVFRFYADPATRAPALLSGEADVMGEVLPKDAKELQSNGKFVVLPTSIPGQPLQFFFQTRFAPTDDLKVRKAILLAADRGTVVRNIFGEYSPVATGPLTAVTWGAKPVVPADLFNLQEAERLLSEAGWADSNNDGIREKEGTQLILKVVYPVWGMTPQVAETLKAEWKQAGIVADLAQVPTFSALIEAQKSGLYNLISMNLAGSDPDILYSFFSSEAIYNWALYSDDKLDLYLEQGRGLADLGLRQEAYQKAQELIAEQCLILPIRDYVNLNVASSRVKGLRFSEQGWFPVLIDVSLD